MVEIPEKSRVSLLVEYGKPLEMGECSIPKVEPNAIGEQSDLLELWQTAIVKGGDFKNKFAGEKG